MVKVSFNQSYRILHFLTITCLDNVDGSLELIQEYSREKQAASLIIINTLCTYISDPTIYCMLGQ